MKSAILIAAILAGRLSAAGPAVFHVTTEDLATKPVSPLLAGNFVELGYGFQTEPMMAEMLFNRSFEPYLPYRDNTISWFGLWKNEKDHALGYRTDWRTMSWYHSGYEHNPWFAAPGTEGEFHIDQDSTFFITQSAVRKVRLEPTRDPADVVHGIGAVRLINEEPAEWGALAQEGKYLRRGETYRFRGFLRSAGAPVEAEIRLYPRGQWQKPIAVMKLGRITDAWSVRTAEFRNESFEGYATFSLWIPPRSTVVADNFSLLPASNFHGWREDVVRTIASLSPKVFRFPGGCVASFYDWRDGVGPLDRRRPAPSYFWGGMNYNDLGTDEFAAMCRRVGAEMLFTVNVYNPHKRDYLLTTPNHPPANTPYSFDMSRFTDLETGAKNAAAWVAYCNRSGDGRPKRWDVKYWELDNEPFRWFTAEEYGHAAVVYARAMKAVDPSIKIGIATYGRFRPHIVELLEIAGRDIDFLADRTDSEEGLDEVLAVMRAYNQRTGRRLFYANTEWLPREDVQKRRGDNAVFGITRVEQWDRMSRWRMGMVVLANMMSWQRHGGDVGWVNFNNLANTHAQSAIETPKETAYLTACGVALRAIARSPAAWPLRIAGYETRVADELQVQAAWDAARKRLVLYVLNRSAEPREVVFDLSALERRFRSAAVSAIAPPGPETRNTAAEPDAIRLAESAPAQADVGDRYAVHADAWSFREIILE